jgi:hypothetical protein
MLAFVSFDVPMKNIKKKIEEKAKKAQQMDDPSDELVDEITYLMLKKRAQEAGVYSCLQSGCYVEYHCSDCHSTFEHDEPGDFTCPGCQGELQGNEVHFCMQGEF